MQRKAVNANQIIKYTFHNEKADMRLYIFCMAGVQTEH